MTHPVDGWVASQFPGAQFVHEGGQRRVYEIPEPRSALKIWPITKTSQHERHVREVSALGRLRHEGLPRVVAHLSQVEIDGQVFAMYQEEWLDAPPLMRLIDSLPLDVDSFGRLARTSLETLGHLHAADITHRDISLGNILWDGRRSFVVDLGLAKHRQMDSLTRPDEQLPMTRWTASPEQLQGVGSDLQPATDVYSLGLVMFIASSGRHPFVADDEEPTSHQYLQRQMHRDFQSPVPDHAKFIEKMLEPVALFRPDVRSLLEELP